MHRHQFKTLVSLLIPAIAMLSQCELYPVYRPAVQDLPHLQIKSGKRVALFSMLERSVAVSNSQGTNWIGRRDAEDYKQLHQGLSQIFRQNIGWQMIAPDEIKNLALYQDGYFPLSVKWYNNSMELPVVASEKEAEMMLRTRNRLQADYYITVLMEQSVRKIMLQPVYTKSTLHLTLYDARIGPVYSIELSSGSDALPYNRDLSIKELARTYVPIINQAADNNLTAILKQLAIQMPAELNISANNGTRNSTTDPDVDPQVEPAPDLE